MTTTLAITYAVLAIVTAAAIAVCCCIAIGQRSTANDEGAQP